MVYVYKEIRMEKNDTVLLPNLQRDILSSILIYQNQTKLVFIRSIWQRTFAFFFFGINFRFFSVHFWMLRQTYWWMKPYHMPFEEVLFVFVLLRRRQWDKNNRTTKWTMMKIKELQTFSIRSFIFIFRTYWAIFNGVCSLPPPLPPPSLLFVQIHVCMNWF